jgi:hypothetical protein
METCFYAQNIISHENIYLSLGTIRGKPVTKLLLLFVIQWNSGSAVHPQPKVTGYYSVPYIKKLQIMGQSPSREETCFIPLCSCTPNKPAFLCP